MVAAQVYGYPVRSTRATGVLPPHGTGTYVLRIHTYCTSVRNVLITPYFLTVVRTLARYCTYVRSEMSSVSPD